MVSIESLYSLCTTPNSIAQDEEPRIRNFAKLALKHQRKNIQRQKLSRRRFLLFLLLLDCKLLSDGFLHFSTSIRYPRAVDSEHRTNCDHRGYGRAFNPEAEHLGRRGDIAPGQSRPGAGAHPIGDTCPAC